MFTIFKHIILYLSAGLIVTTTGGIGLLQHHCRCDDACSHMVSHRMDCCEVPVADECCADPGLESFDPGPHPLLLNTSDTGEEENTHGCCWSEYTFFKTDPFSNPTPVKKNYPFLIAYQLKIQEVPTPQTCTISFVNEVNLQRPPPEFGKKLLIQLHQLKSDPHTV